ncbi:hypothetical protein [Streptomyces sp. NPDC101455]|uniref:hypothetical protein n=1 Tax=Streptomyces sp. NPDC101455 TaxID=3366142 RepID=UPI0038257EE2
MEPRKLPPPIKPRKLMRRRNPTFGFDYFTSDGRYEITPQYADNRYGGRTARIDRWAVRDLKATDRDGNTRYHPLLVDVRLYYCAPGGNVPFLVCGMDEGVMRVEPTRSAAAHWRTYFDDDLTIVRADRARFQGWDPVQQPAYPFPDEPFEYVERPKVSREAS